MSDFPVIPYGLAHGGQSIDWSNSAVERHLRDHGRDYRAVLVDFTEKGAALAVKSSGYEGQVIGLITHNGDQIPGVDQTVVLRMDNTCRTACDISPVVHFPRR